MPKIEALQDFFWKVWNNVDNLYFCHHIFLDLFYFNNTLPFAYFVSFHLTCIFTKEFFFFFFKLLSKMQCALCTDISRTDGFTSGATFRDGCSPMAGPCSLPYTLQVLYMQQVLYFYSTVPYTLQVLDMQQVLYFLFHCSIYTAGILITCYSALQTADN